MRKNVKSRTERDVLHEWWWNFDPWLFFIFALLMALGVAFSFSASPPVAVSHNLPIFYFIYRQALFIPLALGVILATACFSPLNIRRVSLLIFCVSIFLVYFVVYFGVDIKGARRWLTIAGFSFQPSEILKPAFVILSAWALSEKERRPEMPGVWVSFFLFVITILPLILQPDIGMTALLTAVWLLQFFLVGIHFFWVIILLLTVSGAAFLGYVFLPHVRARVDSFLSLDSSIDTFQVDRARDSFFSGGWFGKGPGEGVVKRVLPDSHTDYTLAVVAEEFGLLMCMFVVLLFLLIVIRCFLHAFRHEDPFSRFAIVGLTALFGLQASINIAVNLDLVPPKGMTLPFISYGRSSFLSTSFLAGTLLALTRRRPEAPLLPSL